MRRELPPDVAPSAVQRARELLELERATMRTFTSCAWFFDEVDRIEVRQVLRYAARAIELTGHASRLTPEFVEWLAPATSGAPGAGSASELFVREALPHHDATVSAAAGAIASASAGIGTSRIATFDVVTEVHSTEEPDADAAHAQRWKATLGHRRTGAVRAFVGFVHGAGAELTVTLTETGVTLPAVHEINIHEFPETIARQILQPLALTDDALYLVLLHRQRSPA